MKWISHKILTGSIVYAITGNSLAAIFASAGSIIPDAIEGFPDENNYSSWRKNHRKISHWLPIYLTFFIVLFPISYFHFSDLSDIIQYLSCQHPYLFLAYGISFMALGACFHILEDAICGKVPSLNPQKKIGIKLFYVGSIKEYTYIFPISMALLLLRY